MGARSFGQADAGAPDISVELRNPATPGRLVRMPELALGEAYVEGDLVIEGDDLHGLFELLLRNRMDGTSHPALTAQNTFLTAAKGFMQRNHLYRARQNVAHHYDLSGDLYDLFLDEDRQYSCAYFSDPGMSLDQAQAAKKHHIARKLLLRPGMRVLDIGCGWGGMALTLARDYGVEVLGVTLSREQHAQATARAEKAGLTDRVSFRLQDYRRVRETFDRVVSVGMFEHVGAPNYEEYFDTVRARLSEDGIALIHTIGRGDGPGVTSPWINKYIFPGGYIPALSEIMPTVERTRMWPADIEVWRLHYAQTLRHWHDRFCANIDRARALYDERFCRMWRYYLVASEQSFRFHRHVVYQLQLARRVDAVPLTRDYLYTPSDRERLAAE
ncbi:MAG: cyclopropane-fatty-acyl-phospholipid synthase family protein [Pseudomonadota bacterium]